MIWYDGGLLCGGLTRGETHGTSPVCTNAWQILDDVKNRTMTNEALTMSSYLTRSCKGDAVQKAVVCKGHDVQTAVVCEEMLVTLQWRDKRVEDQSSDVQRDPFQDRERFVR